MPTPAEGRTDGGFVQILIVSRPETFAAGSVLFCVTIMYIEAMYIEALTAILLICGLVALPGRSADDPPITKSDLKQAVGNIRRIAKAFHAHADKFVEHLPVNIVDKDDQPLLSWRVALLPFIEQQELYKEFKLDEPWDSEHNKKLIERMPKIYAPIHVKAMTGETFYQVFIGKDALFGPGKNPRLTRDIPKPFDRRRKGKDEKAKDVVEKCIYKLDKDTLTICTARTRLGVEQLGTLERPKEFKTTEGGTIFVYKREKE
jgi:hypothetical protein